jgi:hypothetical protein
MEPTNWAAPHSVDRMPKNKTWYGFVRRNKNPKKIHILIKFGYALLWEAGFTLELPTLKCFRFTPWLRFISSKEIK